MTGHWFKIHSLSTELRICFLHQEDRFRPVVFKVNSELLSILKISYNQIFGLLGEIFFLKVHRILIQVVWRLFHKLMHFTVHAENVNICIAYWDNLLKRFTATGPRTPAIPNPVQLPWGMRGSILWLACNPLTVHLCALATGWEALVEMTVLQILHDVFISVYLIFGQFPLLETLL